MVALLTKLKWRLWTASFKQKSKIFGVIVGLVYSLPVVGLTLIGLFALAGGLPEKYPQIAVLVGAVVALGWLLGPLFTTGMDDSLSPSKFSLLPLRARQLQPGMLVASLVSIPAVLTLVTLAGMTLATEIAVVRTGGGLAIVAMVLAPFAVLAGFVICLLLPRAIVTSTSVGGVSRRRREVTGAIGLIGAIAVLYAFQLFVAGEAQRFATLNYEESLERVSQIAGWTPLGAPFALPFDVAGGQWLAGLGRLVLTVGTIVGLWLWWRRGIAASLVTGNYNASSVKAKALRGSFIPRVFPADKMGAVAARSLRYWLRDMRYKMNLILMPIVGLFLIALSVVNDTPATALLAPVLVGWMMAMSVSNSYGFDGPALWQDIVAGLDAKTAVRGRSLAYLTLFAPLVVIFAVVAVIVTGWYYLLVPGLGVALGVLLCGAGSSAVIAVALPYPVKAPGGSAFQNNSGTAGRALLASFGSMLAFGVVLLPIIVCAIISVFVPWMIWVTGLVGLATGVGVLALGWYIAARILDRRQPEIFAEVRTWA